MPQPKLTVVRGQKRVPAKRGVERRDIVARWRPVEPSSEVRQLNEDVIPLLEGWARLVERQAAAMKKAL